MRELLVLVVVVWDGVTAERVGATVPQVEGAEDDSEEAGLLGPDE